MRGYKAFNKDLKCRDMQYEIGKEYVFEGEPIPCEQGFHFCETIGDCYNFYQKNENTRICEIEATGEIKKDELKYITNKIKIIKEITKENIRKGNIGNYNTGYLNSGYENNGDRNCGDKNSGDWNCGDKNKGNFNTGDANSGYYNSGNFNYGYRNSGDKNSGGNNSGDKNSGNWNSGDRNSGIGNSGDWNRGNQSSGVFNTEKNPTIKMFDKESSWTYDDWLNSHARIIMERCPYSYSDYIGTYEITDKEKENHPEYKTTGGYVKVYIVTTKDRQEWWDKLSKKDKDEVKALPNFDEKKFCECVGIEHI